MRSVLASLPCTSRPLPLPSKVCSALGKLPNVADIPQMANVSLPAEVAGLGWGDPALVAPTSADSRQVLSRASASCTCTPRLLPSSSCHSSTTTSLTLPSVSRASARANKSDRLSGVVMSTVGRRWFCALRSAAGVSPLRAPALQKAKRGVPSSLHAAFNTSSGCCSARSVSAASARIGVIHSTVSGAANGFLDFATFLIATSDRGLCANDTKDIKAPSQTA